MYCPHMSTESLRRISQCGSLKKMLPTPDLFTIVVAKLNTAVFMGIRQLSTYFTFP